MTNEEIKVLDLEGIEARAEAIAEEMNVDGADLDALNNEVTALEERRQAIIAERKSKVDAIISGAGKEVEKMEERAVKTLDEIRASQEYINAYAEYLKSGDATECRSLLTDNVSGQTGTAGVPVPTYVEDRIRTAWDNDEIMSRVRRSNIAGNLKVGFELSADPAVEHTEGSGAIDEEKLLLGIVELVPKTLKKFITISDEVMDMKGQAFLDYVYDEIEYRIVKLAADKVVDDITSAPTTATTSAASVAHVETTGIKDIVNAISKLSDEARNPVVIINKATYAYYKGLAMQANYGFDVFDGLTVLFNNTLADINDTPASGDTNFVGIVGDLDGESCNFPNGYEPTFKYDDLSLAEQDLVKVVGRLPMAHGVTANGRFAVITKTGA